MRLLDWLRGTEETHRSAKSLDDLDRVLATMDRIVKETERIDPARYHGKDLK